MLADQPHGVDDRFDGLLAQYDYLTAKQMAEHQAEGCLVPTLHLQAPRTALGDAATSSLALAAKDRETLHR